MLALIDELWSECAFGKYTFRFSGKLCDSLELCYDALGQTTKKWRDYASPELLAEKDSPDAWKTNYDLEYVTGRTPKEPVREAESCEA